MTPRQRQRFTGVLLAVAYALLAVALTGWAFLTVTRFQAEARAEEDAVAAHARSRAEIERLRAAQEHSAVEARSYLMTLFPPLLQEREAARARALRVLAVLRGRLDSEGRALLVKATAAEEELDAIYRRAVEVVRRGGPAARGVGATFVSSQASPRRRLDELLQQLAAREESLIAAARETARESASRALQELVQVAAVALLLASALAFFLARAFREVRRNEDQLARRNQDLDAFAGRVAHDLRGVLAGLPLVAGSLQRLADGKPSADAATLAGRLDRLNRQSTKLIEGLLAFARAGGATDLGAVSSASQVVNDAIEDLLPLAQAGDVIVDKDLQSVHARCHGPLFHVACVNLLSNAIKFSAGRAERRVRVRTRVDGARCLVEIEDSGPGIPPDALPRVFEPFYRAPGTKAEGCGIGLATVRRIADAHGGTVEVRSELGRGTIARLWLPMAEVLVEEKPVAGPVPEPEPEPSTGTAPSSELRA